MENDRIIGHEYRIYTLLCKNVFGFTAQIDGLGNTSKSYKEYSEAKAWIINNGVKHKEYVILEVFKKN